MWRERNDIIGLVWLLKAVDCLEESCGIVAVEEWQTTLWIQIAKLCGKIKLVFAWNIVLRAKLVAANFFGFSFQKNPWKKQTIAQWKLKMNHNRFANYRYYSKVEPRDNPHNLISLLHSIAWKSIAIII